MIINAGFAVVNVVVCGQMLSAVSDYTMTIAVGCVIVAVISYLVSVFGVGLWNRVYLVSHRGSSVGQGLVGIKVVDVAGNRLTGGTAFVRLLAQAALSIVPFGGLLDLAWPLWDPRRQALHDKAVNCFVVNKGQ